MNIVEDIEKYAIEHGKNGGGGTTIINGRGSKNYGTINATNINANKGNINYLTTRSLTANNAEIIHLITREGSIMKLDGDQLRYNSGTIGTLASDEITTKKLTADDISALTAWIETLNSKEITTEYLTVTKQAHFFELVIDKIRSVGGQLIITPASCTLDYVYAYATNGTRVTEIAVDSNDGHHTMICNPEIAYFDCYFRSIDDSGRSVTNDWLANDQAICQSFNNVHAGVNYNVSNKYYWRLVNSVLPDKYINLSTGAMSDTSNDSTYNSLSISMSESLTNMNNNYVSNGIRWKAKAQDLSEIGIETNVRWNGSNSYNTTLSGIMNTASASYGIEILPQYNDKKLIITNRLNFNIKLSAGNNAYTKAKNVNIGVYFEDDTFMYFPDVNADSNYDIILDLVEYDDEGNVSFEPKAQIESIIIICTEPVDWHLCHGIRISNTVMDSVLDKYSSVPSVGDNVVMLGHRAQANLPISSRDIEVQRRQSAIIISAYWSIDQGGPIDGEQMPAIVPPSYAQYIGIDDFNLYIHRHTYFDANGAKFRGDISLCTVSELTLQEWMQKQQDTLLNSLRIITSAEYIKMTFNPSNNTYIMSPSAINVDIIKSNEEGVTTSSNVPEGYTICISYIDVNNSQIGNLTILSAGSNLHGLSVPTNTTRKIRIILRKNKDGVLPQEGPIIDLKDLQYVDITNGQNGTDGGKYVIKYKRSATNPGAPTAGTDGSAAGWSEQAPDPLLNANPPQWIWMTQCFVDASGTYGTWTTPIRITGDNGRDGEDGDSAEFIYTNGNMNVAKPSAPSAPPQNQLDDWPHYSGNPNGDHETVNGITWYDNPQGVSEQHQCEFVSMRTKAAGTSVWGQYSTPVLWSKWGEKGMDGDGYEYVYKLYSAEGQYNAPASSGTGTVHGTSTSYSDTIDDWVPSGWTDDPLPVSATSPFQYCSMRRKTNGHWGAFSTPVIWNMYVLAANAQPGRPGADGEINYLMPLREFAYYDMISSIDNNSRCKLKVDLDYQLIHVEGDSSSTVAWTNSGFSLYLEAYNKSFNKITSFGTNGTYTISNGAYTNNDFMTAVVSGSPDYLDYLNGSNYAYAPVYFKVILKKGNDILDERIVWVQVESGAVHRVYKDLNTIVSATATSVTNIGTTVSGLSTSVNNLSTTVQQMPDQIKEDLTSDFLENLDTSQIEEGLAANITKTANSIRSEVKRQYSLTDANLTDSNSQKVTLDLTGKDANLVWKVEINVGNNGGINSGATKKQSYIFQIDRQLQNSSAGWGSPGWGKQSEPKGFDVMLNWTMITDTNGTWNNGNSYINQYWLLYAEGLVVGDFYDTSASNGKVSVYLAGGSKYYLRCDRGNLSGHYSITNTSKSKASIVEPETFVPTMSAITQTADSISLRITQMENNGGVDVEGPINDAIDGVKSQLRSTGIDIDFPNGGKITLDAAKTNVTGSLNVYDTGGEGFKVWNGSASSATKSVQVSNKELGQVQNYVMTNVGNSRTSSINVMGLDGLACTPKYNQLMWWGKSNYDDKYEFIVRNKDHNLRITENGIMRNVTWYNGLYGGQWADNTPYLTDDKTILQSGQADYKYWGDISTTSPVFVFRGNHDFTSNMSGQAGMYPDANFRRCGIFINGLQNGSGSSATVFLPYANVCPGRVVYFKGTGGDITLTTHESSAQVSAGGGFMNPNNRNHVATVNIGARSVMLVAGGGQWIIFNCGAGL